MFAVFHTTERATPRRRVGAARSVVVRLASSSAMPSIAAADLTRATDATALCAFRAAFGALMLVHVVRLHVHGLYSRSVLMPGFHFDFGFAVPVPSSDVAGMAHLVALGIAALGVAVGVHSRACALAFALLYGWFVLCERTMFNNHFYLYTLLATLLSLIKAQQRFALCPHAGRAGDRCHAWERAALRTQLCIVRGHTRRSPSARQRAATTVTLASVPHCRCTCTRASPSSTPTGSSTRSQWRASWPSRARATTRHCEGCSADTRWPWASAAVVEGVGASLWPGSRAASGHWSLRGRCPLGLAERVCHGPATRRPG